VEIIDGEDYFEIQAIINHELRGSGRNRQRHYLIHWKGYEEIDRTWEPRSEVQHLDLVREYEQNLPTHQQYQPPPTEAETSPPTTNNPEATTRNRDPTTTQEPPEPTPTPNTRPLQEPPTATRPRRNRQPSWRALACYEDIAHF
jgi:hypothetical protein